MSMLNEALRKKAAEETPQPRTGLIVDDTAVPEKKSRKRLLALLLFTSLCIVGGLFALEPLLYQDESVTKAPVAAHQPVTAASVQPVTEIRPSATNSTGSRPPALKEVSQTITPKPHVPKTPAKPRARIVSRKQATKQTPRTGQRRPNPKTVRPFLQKALDYQRQNKLDEAARLYRQVLEKSPENPEALFNLATVYIRKSEVAAAYPLLKKLESRDPENQAVLLNLAIVEIGRGNPRNAIAQIEKVEALDRIPRFETLFHKSVALSQLGSLGEALAGYQKAEKLNPVNPHLLFNMALLYDKMRAYAQAVRYYTKFTALDPSQSVENKAVHSRILELNAYLASQPDEDPAPKPAS